MAPCNMKCNTCGDYIAKGKKFNARKETVENESYLGLKVFRFYFKCPRCMQEITFKTDPKNMDYEVEHGATQNFKALKLAEQQAVQEQKDKEEDEKLNPMKLLENRTKASRIEMETIEALEDLKEMNQNKNVLDFESIRKVETNKIEQQLAKQEEEDELFVKSIFQKNVKTLPEDDSDEDEKLPKFGVTFSYTNTNKSTNSNNNSNNNPSKRKLLQKLVIVKKPKSDSI